MKDLDLLILRNRVLKLGKFHIWVVLPCKCCRLADFQESYFQASKRTNMGIAVLEVGRSANNHELFSQAAYLSDIDCVELQAGLFADRQECDLQAAKRSD